MLLLTIQLSAYEVMELLIIEGLMTRLSHRVCCQLLVHIMQGDLCTLEKKSRKSSQWGEQPRQKQ